MNIRQIRQLVEQKGLPDSAARIELIETHISWVLLTDNFAFKIKKPELFSFLDFSTLERRKFYCDQELRLNRRLAPDIYLDVLPIYAKDGKYAIGHTEGGVLIDYALQLKRLHKTHQMDELLKAGEVEVQDVLKIAEVLADFHSKHRLCQLRPNLMVMQDDFADILKIRNFITAHVGETARKVLEHSVSYSQQFLKRHATRITERYAQGFVVDGHGDLHSGNIFIYEKPIIFDCIEFSEHFRQLDVLSEIAFLCMNLAFHKQSKLEDPFVGCYLAHFPAIQKEADWEIFHYYKLYRANVRLKVAALAAMQVDNQEAFQKHLSSVTRHYKLLKNYLQSATVEVVG